VNLVDVWMCLSVAALLGVFAGWLVWGRHSEKVVASYRARLGKMRRNWETIEHGLAEELKRVSALERKREELVSELQRSRSEFESTLHSNEEAWRNERRSLEDALKGLRERVIALEGAPQAPAPEVQLVRRGRQPRRSPF
jgi:chromosome segregation ATPase